MNKDLFEKLTQSIKEAGQISRRQMKPSRVFPYHKESCGWPFRDVINKANEQM